MPHQVSIFAENKPGKIEKITALLAEQEVNIRAITISDSGDYGIIKLLVDKPDEASVVLRNAGVAASLKEIVAVKIDDRPGGLLAVSKVLSNAKINVEDAYGFLLQARKEAIFVFQTDNVTKSENALIQAGFKMVSDEELYYI